MKHYLIHFVEERETTYLYWRGPAEDYAHAIEQIKEQVHPSTVVFHEVIKAEY